MKWMKKRWWFLNQRIVTNRGPPKNSAQNLSCDTEAGDYEFLKSFTRFSGCNSFDFLLIADILERLATVHRMRNRSHVLCPVARSDIKMWTASNTIRKMVTKRKDGKFTTIKPLFSCICDISVAMHFRHNGFNTFWFWSLHIFRKKSNI